MPAAPAFPPQTTSHRPPPAARIEALEQRVTPAAIVTHWVGSSGEWTDPTHWDNGVPDNADGNSYTAIIDVGLLDPMVTLATDIQISTLVNAEALTVTAGHTAVLVALENSGSISIAGEGVLSLESGVAGLTTAKLGAVHVTGGTFQLNAALNNTGATLTIDSPTGAWQLGGATITGGMVIATAGSKLTVHALDTGTAPGLDGVTLNADLTVTGASAGAGLEITQGLTLNGIATLGAYGSLKFAGTQTLGGTGKVVFTDHLGNSITQTGQAPVLTIASGITVRGGATPFKGAFVGLNDGGTIINDGTVSSDVTGMNLDFLGSVVVNHGTIETKNGAHSAVNLATNSGTLRATGQSSLLIGGTHWTNTGSLTETDSSLFLAGSVTTAGLGTTNFSGGNIYVRGEVDNSGNSLILGKTPAWWMDGGAIRGGNVVQSSNGNGPGLKVTSLGGILDGITLSAALNLNATARVGIEIQHGLTLNAPAIIGLDAVLIFAGTQTLSGSGTVTLMGGDGALIQTGAAPVLTIGSGITIRGGSSGNVGRIGRSPVFGGANDGTIINAGRMQIDPPSFSLLLNSGTFANQGTISTFQPGATVTIENLTVNTGTIEVSSGALFIGGDHWTSPGRLTIDKSAVTFGGSFDSVELRRATISASAVHLTGNVENVGATIPVSGAFFLDGGSILGGTVSGQGSVYLTDQGGNLSGVTFNTNVSVSGDTVAGASIYNGLTLNATLTMGQNSLLNFMGSQSLEGTGVVRFLDQENSCLRVATSGATLVIGQHMTIRGGSAAADGACLGYSDRWPGPTDFLIVNKGTILAEFHRLQMPAGRLLNTNVLSWVSFGTLDIAHTIPTTVTELENGDAPYTFQDATGTAVSVRWTGAGLARLTRIVDPDHLLADLYSILAFGSDLTSSLSITTAKGTIGADATTSIGFVEIDGALKALNAPSADLRRHLYSAQSIGALTLGDVAGTGSLIRIGPRPAGDTKTTTSLTFDQLTEVQIVSGTPILTLTAAQWLDRDTTPDYLTAPSLGTLSIKAAPNRGLSQDFEADLSLTGEGVAPTALTLGRAAIAGNLASSTWNVTGNAGSIALGSAPDWTAHFSGSLVSLTTTGRTGGDLHIGPRAVNDATTTLTLALGSAEELSIHSATPVKSLITSQWLDRQGAADVLTAPSLGVLTIKGDAARGIAGDFEADLTLAGGDLNSSKPMLGAVTVAGKIVGSTWSVAGLSTSVKAAGFIDWHATFSLGLASLTSTGDASGDIHIGARDLTTKATLSFDTVSELSVFSFMPIGSLTTRQWLDRDGAPDLIEAPALGTLTVKGDTRVTRPLAGDFEAGLLLTGDGLAPTAKALGPVTVKGKIDAAIWTVQGAAGALTAGSTGTGWNATFTKAVTSMTASTLSGSLQASSIGTVKADHVTQLNLTLTQPVSPLIKALGTLTVKNEIERSTIRAAGNIGTVTAAEIAHSRLFAGVGSGVNTLPTSNATFVSAATIAKLVVTGVAGSSNPGLVDSFIAASKITSASITRFAPANNGHAYGLSADAIASLTLKTAASTTTQRNLDDPLADASGGVDDFIVRIL